MKHTYFNDYYILENFKVSNQETLKKFIISFAKGMESAGVLRATLSDQLDLTNIPNLSTHAYGPTSSTGTHGKDKFDSASLAVYHKPIIYNIFPRENEINTYISFQFGYAVIRPPSTANPDNIFYDLVTKINISTAVNTNNQLQDSYTVFDGRGIFYTNVPSTDQMAIQYINMTKSYINYNDNILFMDICPGIATRSNTLSNISNMTKYSVTTAAYYSQLKLCIVNDAENGIKTFIKQSNSLWSAAYSLNSTDQKPFIAFIYPDGSFYNDSNLSTVYRYTYNYNYNSNGNLYLNPARKLSKNNDLKYDYKILIGETTSLGIKSGTTYKVNIGTDEEVDYILWSSHDSQSLFNGANTDTSILIYNGD